MKTYICPICYRDRNDSIPVHLIKKFTEDNNWSIYLENVDVEGRVIGFRKINCGVYIRKTIRVQDQCNWCDYFKIIKELEQ